MTRITLLLLVMGAALAGCGKKDATQDAYCQKVTACCKALSPEARAVGKVDFDCDSAAAADAKDCDVSWAGMQHELGNWMVETTPARTLPAACNRDNP